MPKSTESYNALNDLECGHFLLYQVPHHSMLLRKKELIPIRGTIKSNREYRELLKLKPQETEVRVALMREEPKDYDSNMFGR